MKASGLKRYRLVIIVLVANSILAMLDSSAAERSAMTSLHFLKEVAMILPPVMVLMGLLDAWVPRKLVEAHLGPQSGMRGSAFSIMLGTAAAGPLYAAFPIALSLREKGARLANIVIFLGTWASIKIPMILMEASFIGLRFAMLRLVFTIPLVLAMGYIMESLMPAYAHPVAEPAGGE